MLLLCVILVFADSTVRVALVLGKRLATLPTDYCERRETGAFGCSRGWLTLVQPPHFRSPTLNSCILVPHCVGGCSESCPVHGVVLPMYVVTTVIHTAAGIDARTNAPFSPACTLLRTFPFNGWVASVQITDIVVGDGAAADTGKGVTLKWVMRRSNGYYVSSSAEGEGEPFIYRVRIASFIRQKAKGRRTERVEEGKH